MKKIDDEDLIDVEDFQEEFEFDEEDFQTTKKVKKGRKTNKGHYVFFAIVAVLLIVFIIRLIIWNRGVQSDYDENEVTTQFDTEPNDYIQPMTTQQLAGKEDDGVTTILTLGNSGFADNGDNNLLAKALGEKMNANIINCAIPGSYMSRSLADNLDIMNPGDGTSLYYVVEALVTGDSSKVIEGASTMDGIAQERAQRIAQVDMSKVDCIVMFYDISDYISQRLLYVPDNEDHIMSVQGALNSSIKKLQEAYPYIRIIVMSPPASGMEVDGYFIDAASVDMGSGTIDDYMGQEVAVAAANGVSFIDLFYGAINVENKDEYITDGYHLNEAGANIIADRFATLIQDL